MNMLLTGAGAQESKNEHPNTEFGDLPNPFNVGWHEESALISLEKLLLQLLGSIKDKPNWKVKIKDVNIKKKYMTEMREQLEARFAQEVADVEKMAKTDVDYEGRQNMYQIPPHLKIIPKDIVEYVMSELVYWSEREYDMEEIAAAPIDGVYLSDHDSEDNEAGGLLSESVRERFHEGITKLETSISDKDKDYHPGSDGLILDLIHPSLYCLVYDVSMICKKKEDMKKKAKLESGAGKSSRLLSFNLCKSSTVNEAVKQLEVAKLSNTVKGEFTSEKYQWLPCEVSVNNGKVSIDSYINNLHPEQHADLYSSIEDILSAFIPMFNEVLRNLKIKRTSPESMLRIGCESWNWYDEQPNLDDDDEDDDRYERYLNTRTVNIPPLPTMIYGANWTGGAGFRELTLDDRKLQVIVKLANIELTPDKPAYPGGVWHVEGMSNENIVATGIYYYDIYNISQSKLSFRAAIDEDNIYYEQNDNAGVKAVFGLENDDALNQYRGYVSAIKGRMLAFPNIY